MEESKWWSRLLLMCGAVSLVLLLTAPLGHKFGVVALGPSFMSLMAAVLLAVVVLIGGIVMAVIAGRKELGRDRSLCLIAAALGLLPILIMAPSVLAGGGVPPIHDITTDTADPPTFGAVLPLRVDAPNDVEYGQPDLTAAEMANLQRQAYPAVKTLRSDLPAEGALDRAEAVLREQGLEIVGRDAMRVEATATTFWFGFKDDVVVRVRGVDGGSLVDVRSVSRVGRSDLGANARRIEGFLAAF
ncbi:MAG: hypothetical protein CMD83_11585 [Gammaproteobacteria bacterium]|nr:hypothetical protein [Gammaproteobacteria bacterium]